MDYKKKVEYAEQAALQLDGIKTSEEIKTDLKSKGLYNRDISNIMVSALKILGEKYQPLIRQYILENKEIKGATPFTTLDSYTLDKLTSMEHDKCKVVERRKIARLIKEGNTPEHVYQQVDFRFITQEQATTQISKSHQVQSQNRGTGRLLNIGGGLGLILLTGVILVVSGRLFYVLPVIGIALIVKGFFTERMEYDN